MCTCVYAEMLLVETFASLSRKAQTGKASIAHDTGSKAPSRDTAAFWPWVSRLTQRVVDACMESGKKDGARVVLKD